MFELREVTVQHELMLSLVGFNVAGKPTTLGLYHRIRTPTRDVE